MARKSIPVVGFAAAFLLTGAAVASADPVASFAQLQGRVKSGDHLVVTLWSEQEHRGPVAELTPCSLTIVTRGERVRIEGANIRKIKRLGRFDSGSPPVADAARSCDGAACAAMSLAFSTGTTFGRAFRFLTGPPTVYRVSKRDAAGCRAAPIGEDQRQD